MSLRRALAALPDDRSTRSAIRTVIAFLDAHKGQRFDTRNIVRGTGLDDRRVEQVMGALAAAFVIDCDGDPSSQPCAFTPDSVLSLEIRHYLRTSAGGDAGLQRGVDRFRGRSSPGI